MNNASHQPSPTYLQLRQRILGFNPDELGFSPTEDAPHVWGVLMETGYEVGTATLVSLVDGTTSLYYSTGGGLIGSGDYASLANASKALVTQAESHLEQMPAIEKYPLPGVGQVSFILLTYAGIFSEKASEKALQTGDHQFSPLFMHAQAILTQLRLLAERRQNQ